MLKRIPAFLILCLVCAVAAAQSEMTARVVSAKVTVTKRTVTETITEIDGISSTSEAIDQGESLSSNKPVGLIGVKTTATIIWVKATDASRLPVELAPRSPDSWTINQPGKFWIDCLIIDFDKRLPENLTDILVIPGDIPPIDPPPPPPGEISPLEKVCRDALAGVTDPQKAAKVVKMAELYIAEAVKIEAGKYSTGPEMMAAIQQGNRDILGEARQGWQEWRTAIAAALTEMKAAGKLETVKDHAPHWRGIARGLK